MKYSGYYGGSKLEGWDDTPVGEMRACLSACSQRADCMAARMYKNYRCWLLSSVSSVWTQYGGYRFMAKIPCDTAEPAPASMSEGNEECEGGLWKSR